MRVICVLWGLWATGWAVAHTLKDERVEITIDDKGNLTGLRNLRSGHNYAGGQPLWRLYFDRKDSEKEIEVRGAENFVRPRPLCHHQGLTRTLARTGAPLGITVNAIAPGCIETELLHQTLGERGVEEMRAKILLGLGTPRDVGLAVAFLCGEGGRYITGATLDVNGGLYMR